MNNKLVGVIEGILITALGVIMAIYGGGSALDVYFAIISLVAGVTLAVLAIIGLSKKGPLNFGLVILATIFIFVGAFLFTDYLTFAALINLLVIVLMGLGSGLVICGIYSLVKKNIVVAIAQLLVGVLVIVFTILFLTVNDFRTVFWIVMGILIAVYGVFVIIDSLVLKSQSKK